MPSAHRDPSFRILVDSQNDIGWPQMLRGRFSHHWVQLQQDHIDHDDEVSSLKFTGQRWLQKVLHHVWTHLCMAWTLRDADLHGIDAANQEAKRKAKLKPDTIALCAKADKLMNLDKRLFEMPLELRLTKTKSKEQSAWINVVSPTVRTAMAEADDHVKKSQPDIRKCFLGHSPVPAQIPPRSPIPRLRDG
jgi:hypothetical protein